MDPRFSPLTCINFRFILLHMKSLVLPTDRSWVAKLLLKLKFASGQARIEFRNLKLRLCSLRKNLNLSVWMVFPLQKNGCGLFKQSGYSLHVSLPRLLLYPSNSTKAPLKWPQTDSPQFLAGAHLLALGSFLVEPLLLRPLRAALRSGRRLRSLPAGCWPWPLSSHHCRLPVLHLHRRNFSFLEADTTPRWSRMSQKPSCRGLAVQSQRYSKAVCNN